MIDAHPSASSSCARILKTSRTTFWISFAMCLCLAGPATAQVGSVRNGLPPTTLDSFVYEAGGNAEFVYGDEGDTNIPPYFSFLPANRINAGIFDQRDKGLTTGHGSCMPDAWGADEFIQPPGEWSQSGTTGDTGSMYGAADTTQPAADWNTGTPQGSPDPSTQQQNSSDNWSNSKHSKGSGKKNKMNVNHDRF